MFNFLHVPQNGPHVLCCLLEVILVSMVHFLDVLGFDLVDSDRPEPVQSILSALILPL